MGGQQSVGRNDIATQPLFYDSRKIPKGAYHMLDKLFENEKNPDPADIKNIEGTFPRSTIITTENVVEDYDNKGHYRFKIRKLCDIFQVISQNEKCQLHANGMKIHLGVGTFSFLSCMPVCTDFWVEDAFEVKYYFIDRDLKDCFPDTANFQLHGQNYAMGAGAIGKHDKPIFDVIKGTYRHKYLRSEYITAKITSHQIEKIVDDPRLKAMARNGVGMIYLTFPPFIQVSIPVKQECALRLLLDEVLGPGVPANQVCNGGYQLEWADDRDLDEIKQEEDEIDRQMVASAKVQHREWLEKLQRSIDADIFIYELPE